MSIPNVKERRQALAAAQTKLREAMRDFLAAARGVAAVSDDRAAALADAVEGLRSLQTQASAEFGEMMVARSLHEGESVYDRIRRETRERNETKVNRQQRAQKLGEEIIS